MIRRQLEYRGVELVVILQPDSSLACIPAWMTHEAAAQYALREKPRFSVDILRSLGSPRLDEIRCLQPMRPGDRLRVRLTIMGTRDQPPVRIAAPSTSLSRSSISATRWS